VSFAIESRLLSSIKRSRSASISSSASAARQLAICLRCRTRGDAPHLEGDVGHLLDDATTRRLIEPRGCSPRVARCAQQGRHSSRARAGSAQPDEVAKRRAVIALASICFQTTCSSSLVISSICDPRRQSLFRQGLATEKRLVAPAKASSPVRRAAESACRARSSPYRPHLPTLVMRKCGRNRDHAVTSRVSWR